MAPDVKMNWVTMTKGEFVVDGKGVQEPEPKRSAKQKLLIKSQEIVKMICESNREGNFSLQQLSII